MRNFRAFLLCGVSEPSIRAAMRPMTAREMADAMALAYRMLGLSHLDRTAA